MRDLVLQIPPDWSHDAWIVLLISAVASIAIIPQPLIQYRKHADQQIGPLDHSTPEQLALAKGTGPAQYPALAERFILARNRLLALAAADRLRDVVPRLELKIRHIQARAQMPSRRLSRLSDIFRELALWHYHRYSRGFRSAAKDLFL
jgi:hypothetical protein